MSGDINQDVTLLIKTFNRPKSLNNLLSSIRKHYPIIPVCISDDSDVENRLLNVETYLKYENNATYTGCSFDTGASVGRNAGLNQINTKYLVTLDDDFLFTKETNLHAWYGILENSPTIDLVGGDVGNARYEATFEFRDNNKQMRFLKQPKGFVDGFPIYDIVLQFWMGRTEKIKTFGGWNSKFLTIDHLPFFLNGFGKIRVAYTDQVFIDHIPESNKEYHQFRHGRSDKYFKMLLTEYGLDQIIGYHGNIIK
jgi:glycosyltransferase involved in cell wall biosynthesis